MRFEALLQACAADARGRLGHEQDDYPQAAYLLHLLSVARAVDAGEIARSCQDGGKIADAVQKARIGAIESEQKRMKNA